MPATDLLVSIVDTLAKRYGWSFDGILEEMYWEDVYAMYVYASNMDSIETNEQSKFQFLIHAQSKEAIDAWRDFTPPFPSEEWIEERKKARAANYNNTFKRFVKTATMSDERKERFKYISERLQNAK